MPTSKENTDEPKQQEPPQEPESAFVAPATQADFDRIISERVARERAKYADYDEVKVKLATIEDKDKTELERANTALATAQSETAASKRELSILRAASKHNVPADYVDLIDGDDDDAIDAKAARIATLAAGKQAPEGESAPGGYRVADPGQTAPPAPDEDAVKEAFARQLFQV